ncbi:hypothetical protein [Geodermatophilus sp. TF02-6]|uniref:hypothetical protein n=1 Tax=Geodermatophilus sp. TF02-6 TaxID=2250575 RepID=UPI0011BFCC98|nr:hypothetical protein [Geodermatophilus sp. TF02-6]
MTISDPEYPGTATTVAHEKGASYAVKDGVLYVFDNALHQGSDRQLAVHAAGQWLSAVVKKD